MDPAKVPPRIIVGTTIIIIPVIVGDIKNKEMVQPIICVIFLSP